MGRFGRIALKTILWIIASVVILILLVVVLIQVPAVQNFVKNKAVTFLENKIHTKVEIGHISLGLPKLLVLEDVYFEDQKKDTLIAGDKLKVDISMLKLLNNQVEINEINLEGITTKIYRGRDSVFNFDYIIKAFAGEQKKEPKPEDTTSTMKFSVDKVILDRINVSYKDLTTGNDVKFILGHFDTRVKEFDLDKMKFSVPRINLTNVNATIIQTPAGSTIGQVAKVDTAVTPLNLDLSLGIIDLKKIKVDYRGAEMDASVDLGQFLVEMDKIDLKNQNVVVKNIELNTSSAALRFAKPKTVTKAVEQVVKKLDTLASNPNKSAWRASLGKISLVDNDIKFDNDAQAPLRKGVDFAHMHLRNLNVNLTDLAYSPDTIAGKVNHVTFNEQSGLIVKNFHTAFLYGPKSGYMNDLLFETPQTVIQKQVQVTYPSIEAITKNIGQLYINANLNGSKLALRDVLLLMPTMRTMEPFKSSPNAVIRIDGRMAGRVDNLNIPQLEIRGLGNTYIKASARLKGLPNMNKAYFDVNIADFRTTSSDIAKLVPAGTIPSNVSIPAAMNLKGTFKGSMNSFNTKLNLRSSYGAVDLVGSLKNGNSKKNATYAADIKANQLNIGALTKQTQTVGMVTMTAKVKGRGLDPKTASIDLDGNVASAYVKGYTYKNLNLKATGTNGSYTAKATMRDPNISFALDAKANMSKKYPAVSGTFLIDSLDLQKLGFTKDVMRIHGKIIADVPTADPDYLNATIKATDLLVVNKDQRIRMDTITLVSTATADSSTLALKSSIVSINMSGKYQLTQIGTAVQDVINKYFDTGLATTGTPTVIAAKPGYQPQQARFSIRVVKTPLLEQFAPDLKQLDPINITGRFNSATGELVVNGNIPKVVYGSNVINNTKLNINTANNALNYSLTADEIKASSSIDLLNTSVTGLAQNNKLNVSLQVRDINKKERYRIAGALNVLPNQYQFSFAQNGLLLNYVAWAVNADNALLFGNNGINARNLNLTNADQVLSVNSSSVEMNSPITVNFRNFHIETLTTIAQQDSLQVGGVINGEARVANFQSTPEFTAALNIADFSFKGDTVGNIAIKANNQTANAIATNVSITGKGNQVDLNGLYYTEPSGKLEMTLNIVKLNVKSVEGFSFGAIRNAKGDITGTLRITGTTAAPAIRGDVNFNNVGFNVAMLNSYFTMPRESITFNEEGIVFNEFTLVDSTNNKAVISGKLFTKTYTDFRFGLDITSRNFRVMNSTRADNKLYYGKLYLDSDIRIRGTQSLPVVDARLTVNEKTDLTVVLPTNDPGVEDREGVVEFFDESSENLDSILIARQLDSLKQSELTGMDVTATIIIKKEANFNIVIDERNGDVVHLRGSANLNGGIDKSGKISLTGTYEVEQGSYALSYATVKRTFTFKKGSTITWTGDPTSANIDLTAVYVANVPPIDLVADQLGGSENQVQYKQKLPFNVNLSLKNELMKPDISFDIVLPDSTYTVSPTVVTTVNSRLSQIRQDPNELNKQVLGVLVLGHFIGDNPLASQGGSTTVSSVVRNSVSGLLSDQLNKLAGDLIQGVALDFGLTSGEDYASGTATNRTDLNVGLSKRFLDDRLTVSVGNNFNLEGAQQGEKTTNIAGNLSVNYKLSKDGRYTLRAYRREQYVVIQGQIIETGVGFTLTVDYNKFSRIFRRSREDREAQKRYKEQEKRKDEEKERKEDIQNKKAESQPIKMDSVKVN
ncbi:translocation/assembly module TamB domain-containing protein [Mucilaginibacter calamicampi]|uniref:Translocation/assembly module TamB domain-containing protein n=1 Tax=Mucilaginibacter calamicampi TaxID=1302352 RepID=A0ABW2YSG5_9SPHI